MAVSDTLRDAIRNAPLSRYRIAAESGVAESVLSRFVNGQRSLDLISVDKLCKFLGLTLMSVQRPGKARRSGKQE